jgi:integrase
LCYCFGVKATETACNSTRSESSNRRQSHGATFTKVLDGRKQPIRGLWQRNGRFYAQLNLEDSITGEKQTRRVPLNDSEGNPYRTVPEARAALEKLRTQRADNNLPTLSRTPKFSDFADRYLAFIKSGAGDRMKKAGTIAKEEYTLKHWKKHLGDLRLDQIKRAHVNAFVAKRKAEGVANRTVNLDVITLRNVLKHAIDEGHIRTLPTENMRPLRVTAKKRDLFTPADLEKLCTAAFGTRDEDGQKVPVTKNAREFVDYLRLLAYSGARRNEALRLRWQDVDFEREQLTIGAEGDAKNSKPRVVDFNPKLAAHLRDMETRRAPDSQWLFPSPQRGNKNIHAKSFRESLNLTRKAADADIAGVGFHDLRHLFISFCVMSGVDYMTIARWVGHQDGGVLIGKVYGHLADSHTKAQAKRVSFEPQIVKEHAA